MSARLKTVLGLLAFALLCAGVTWWWLDTMELRWKTRERISDAARANPLLGATMLLQQNGHAVTLADSLGELAINEVGSGTLIIGNHSGIMSDEQARQLLAWVRRGNTLVLQPRWIKPAESNKVSKDGGKTTTVTTRTLIAGDPISLHVGVSFGFVSKQSDPCLDKLSKACVSPTPERLRYLTPPGANTRLELESGKTTLVGLPKRMQPLWSDEDTQAVRVYAEGNGHIVMHAGEFFGNQQLRRYDHGEVLLALAGLSPAKAVTIVKNLDVLPWPRALWKHYSALLISLAVCVALALWAGVRRFGPMLPSPQRERRSLLEHIDASGRWLWKAAGGRQLLLEAARADTLALVKRRAPALLRAPEHELPATLGRLTGQREEDVSAALQQDAAARPDQFTRQIRTLQELRMHYER